MATFQFGSTWASTMLAAIAAASAETLVIASSSTGCLLIVNLAYSITSSNPQCRIGALFFQNQSRAERPSDSQEARSDRPHTLPLPHHGRDWRGRDGRGVSRHRHQTRARRG